MKILKEIVWDIAVLVMLVVYWFAMVLLFNFVTHAYLPLKLHQVEIISAVLTAVTYVIYLFWHLHKKNKKHQLYVKYGIEEE